MNDIDVVQEAAATIVENATEEGELLKMPDDIIVPSRDDVDDVAIVKEAAETIVDNATQEGELLKKPDNTVVSSH